MTENPWALALTAIAIIGVLFTLGKLWDDWLNFQAIRQAIRAALAIRGEARQWIALASLVSSAGQFLVWLGFLVIGSLVLSMATPAPAERLPTNLWILRVLLGMEAVLASIQIWQLLVRSRIRRPRVLATLLAVDAPLEELVMAADDTLEAAHRTVEAAQESVDAIKDESVRQNGGK